MTLRRNYSSARSRARATTGPFPSPSIAWKRSPNACSATAVQPAAILFSAAVRARDALKIPRAVRRRSANEFAPALPIR